MHLPFLHRGPAPQDGRLSQVYTSGLDGYQYRDMGIGEDIIGARLNALRPFVDRSLTDLNQGASAVVLGSGQLAGGEPNEAADWLRDGMAGMFHGVLGLYLVQRPAKVQAAEGRRYALTR